MLSTCVLCRDRAVCDEVLLFGHTGRSKQPTTECEPCFGCVELSSGCSTTAPKLNYHLDWRCFNIPGVHHHGQRRQILHDTEQVSNNLRTERDYRGQQPVQRGDIGARLAV